MIEGGTPGGSALAQAAQRRATAEKLLTEAAWLEAVAADERTMAAQLSSLPPSYAVIHDLRVPGSKGNIDHVVVGPGGAFVVMTRRFDGLLAFHDGQLWAGDTSLRGDFESARVESQMLTQSLGTPVVPVIGYLGAGLPAASPTSLDGVLVCAAENLVRVVSRGSHTLLSPDKVAEAARRAVPLQNSPGSVARGEGLVPPPPGAAGLPRPAPAPATPAGGFAAPGPPPGGSPGSAGRAAKGRRSGRSEHEHIAWKRSVKFVAAIIASACLVAFAAGTLLRVLWADKPAGVETDPSALASDPSSTTIFIDNTVLVPPTSAGPSTSAVLAAIPPPVAKFVAGCPIAGKGWSMVLTWPGDVQGLARYDIEVQGPTGQWTLTASATKANPARGAIVGQQPNTKLALRITGVLIDGSRSPATTTSIITPATTC